LGYIEVLAVWVNMAQYKMLISSLRFRANMAQYPHECSPKSEGPIERFEVRDAAVSRRRQG
jgi:hypothetical protein